MASCNTGSCDPVALGLEPSESDGVGDAVRDGVKVGVPLREGVPEDVGDTDGVWERLAVELGVGLTLALAPADREGVGLAVRVGDGVHEASAVEPAGQAAGQPHALHAAAEPTL